MGFEEQHRLRSAFIRDLSVGQLQHSTRPGLTVDDYGPIPRQLVQFWHTESIPADVRRCMESWDVLRAQGVKIRTFDDVSAAGYISDVYGPPHTAAFARCRHPAMRSDYFRLCFISAEGGLYADADDVLLDATWPRVFVGQALKLQALCYDLRAGGMVPASNLLDLALRYDDHIFYVNNNPIAAPPGHPALTRALARATKRLLDHDRAPEIQETTGPGNLTAALAAHARQLQIDGQGPDYELVFDWEETAEPCADLVYRNDERNWRYMRDDHQDTAR